jgi:hypothetical protein
MPGNEAHDNQDHRAVRAADRALLRGAFRSRLLPSYLAFMNPSSAERALDAAIDLELDRLGDLAFAESFAASIGIGSPSDYLPRCLDVDGAPLLCAIRFFGGDRARPFVELIAGERLQVNCEQAALAAMRTYEVFQPTSARLIIPGGRKPDVGPGWVAVQDQVLLVGRVAEMEAGRAEHPLRVSLFPAAHDEAAEFVRAGYARIAAADSALRSRLFPATAEELAECAGHGHLWWWMLEGDRAGLIAARPDSVLGFSGLLMVEELVAQDFSGRGTAAMAQRELASKARATDPDGLMIGTIDAMNAASRATARRAGRSEVLSWWFLTPPGGSADRV